MDSKSFAIYGKLVVPNPRGFASFSGRSIVVDTLEVVGYCPWRKGKFKKMTLNDRRKDLGIRKRSTPCRDQANCGYGMERCRKKALSLGLKLGHKKYPFARRYSHTGCFAYNRGAFRGRAFYGYYKKANAEVTSEAQLTSVWQHYLYRLECTHGCAKKAGKTATTDSSFKEKRKFLAGRLRGLFSGMLLMRGRYGRAKQLMQGLAAFGNRMCIAFRFQLVPNIVRTVAYLGGLRVETVKKPLILSVCLDVVEFQSMGDIYNIVREDSGKNEAMGSMADASWLLSSLPKSIPKGGTVFASIRLRSQRFGFNIYTIAKLCKLHNLMLNIQLSYIRKTYTWRIKVDMDPVDLKMGDPVEKSLFTPGFVMTYALREKN